MSAMLPALGPYLLLGAAFGWLYCRMLRTSVDGMVRRPRPGAWMAAGLAGRLALLLSGLALVAQGAGAMPVLVTLAGFMLARTVAVQRLSMRDHPGESGS